MELKNNRVDYNKVIYYIGMVLFVLGVIILALKLTIDLIM